MVAVRVSVEIVRFVAALAVKACIPVVAGAGAVSLAGAESIALGWITTAPVAPLAVLGAGPASFPSAAVARLSLQSTRRADALARADPLAPRAVPQAGALLLPAVDAGGSKFHLAGLAHALFVHTGPLAPGAVGAADPLHVAASAAHLSRLNLVSGALPLCLAGTPLAVLLAPPCAAVSAFLGLTRRARPQGLAVLVLADKSRSGAVVTSPSPGAAGQVLGAGKARAG